MNLWSILPCIMRYHSSIGLFPFGVRKEGIKLQHNLRLNFVVSFTLFLETILFSIFSICTPLTSNISLLCILWKKCTKISRDNTSRRTHVPWGCPQPYKTLENKIFWTPHYYNNGLQQQYTLLLIWNWCSFQIWATRRLFVKRQNTDISLE